MLVKGKSALVFGCGDEPLPSLFASRGVKVIATDCPLELVNKGWIDTNQHGSSLDKIRKRDICPDENLLQNISFDFVDMNNINKKYMNEQFDFCWSSCSLEHLGSIQKGLDFIENSLRTLKPGGIAVHTTEFNFTSEDKTIEEGDSVLYLKKHIQELEKKLTAQGHIVKSIDYSIGELPLDGFIDIPPYPHDLKEKEFISDSHAHLKLEANGYGCTSIAIIIKKKPR